MRALLSQLSPKGGPEMVRVEDRDVGGVPVRVYTPQEAARGTIILFHGGGWTVGSVADYDHFARSLAELTGHDVVSVEYRLAPENPFPARSEEHTSELQSLMRISYAGFCLKKKKQM